MMGWYAKKANQAVQWFEPMYSYSQTNQGKPTRDGGAYLEAAVKQAILQGNDTVIHYSHGSTNWQAQPTTGDRTAAAQFKLTGYKTLFKGKSGVKSIAESVLKQALANGSPVAISFYVRPGFENLKSSSYIDTDTKGSVLGAHAVLAVGYNSTGLRIQNSWGTAWGQSGYGYLSWSVVDQDVYEAYQATGYKVTPAPKAGSNSDLNGDQLADIVGIYSNDYLYSYTNNGNLTPFNLGTKVSPGWGATVKFGVGDVTGDGKADILAVKSNGDLMLYPNASGAGIKVGVGWQHFTQFEVGDVTGDGYADIVVAQSDGQLFLYPNTRVASHPYSSKIKIGVGWQSFTHLAVGDVTGDGYADIVGALPDGTLRLYTNTKSATSPYSSWKQIGVGWKPYTSIWLSDLNGDRVADIIAVLNDGTLWWWKNNGTGTSYSVRAQIGFKGWSGFKFIG